MYVERQGPKAMISAHTLIPNAPQVFETEVPETFDGTIEIKAISVVRPVHALPAVWSAKANRRLYRSCGARVNKIVEELGGEKTTIVKYSGRSCQFYQ